MTDKLFFASIDGFDRTLADYYSHPFWEEIRPEALIVEIPKPEPIDAGNIATASSPRLWGRIYTGEPPHVNGIAGFWEKYTGEGDILKTEIDKDWIMEHRCEKAVMGTDFLVPPLWDRVFDADLGVGATGVWFTYPIQDRHKVALERYGGWMLTDAPFPYDHTEMMDRDRIAYPPEVFPDDWADRHGDEYLEEVGAGMRTPELAKEDPEGFYNDLLLADNQRYQHVREQLDEYGEQPLTITMTRGVDAMAHKFRHPDDIEPHYPESLQDPERNMERPMDTNLAQIEGIWTDYDFDHLVLGGDHGCGCRVEDGELIFEGDDHEWPAHMAILSDDIEGGFKLRAKYEDVMPTILQLLDIKPPGDIEGASIIEQAKVESRLSDLGYAP